MSAQQQGLCHPNCINNLGSAGKPKVKGATFTSCICLTVPLTPLQVADRQISVLMSLHGFTHFLPSLPLLKAASVPVACTTHSALLLLAQQDRATCMAHSP